MYQVDGGRQVPVLKGETKAWRKCTKLEKTGYNSYPSDYVKYFSFIILWQPLCFPFWLVSFLQREYLAVDSVAKTEYTFLFCQGSRGWGGRRNDKCPSCLTFLFPGLISPPAA